MYERINIFNRFLYGYGKGVYDPDSMEIAIFRGHLEVIKYMIEEMKVPVLLRGIDITSRLFFINSEIIEYLNSCK